MTAAEIAAPHLNPNPKTLSEAMNAVSATRLVAHEALMEAFSASSHNETDAGVKKEALVKALAAVRVAEHKLLAML